MRFAISIIFVAVLATSVYSQKGLGVSKTLLDWNKTKSTGFTQNKGQITDQYGKKRDDVKFIYAANGMNLIFKCNSFSYEIYNVEKGANERISEATGKVVNISKPYTNPAKNALVHANRIDIVLPGANKHPKIITEEQSEDYTNYYTANTAKTGILKVHAYKKLTYKNIWPKIDLVFYAKNKNELKYDIIIRPGGKIEDVKFAYSGMKKLGLVDGKLKFITTQGEIQESIPLSYIAENQSKVLVKLNLYDNVVSYKSDYKIAKNETLVIDPFVKWATYYGGTGGEVNTFTSCEPGGKYVYLSGITESSSSIATSGSHQLTFAGACDIFIAKFDSAGKRQWATYYGGSGTDCCNGIFCDMYGNFYITGTTDSKSGIATTGAYQSTINGEYDALVAKFDGNGIRQWSTYFGGAKSEFGGGICFDKKGFVYFAGTTYSDSQISTLGAFQISNNGFEDIFLTKFNTSGSLQWSTYYGGEGFDFYGGFTIDKSDNIVIVGNTGSKTGISTQGAFQFNLSKGPEVFIVKFSNSGNRLWATYFGSDENDFSYGLGSGDESIHYVITLDNACGHGNTIACDEFSNIYILGYTNSSTGIATAGAFQEKLNGDEDCFLAKFNSAGALQWSTYFGGDSREYCSSILCDIYGSIYITGETGSQFYLTTPNSFQPKFGGMTDLFIAKFSNSGNRIWATYYGGFAHDGGNAILCKDTLGNMCFSGSSWSNNQIATAGSFKPKIAIADSWDAFLVKFESVPYNDVAINALVNLPQYICVGDSFQLGAVLENYRIRADINTKVTITFTGPDTLIYTDSFSVFREQTKDTLWLNKWVHFNKAGKYYITAILNKPDDDLDNNKINKQLSLEADLRANPVFKHESLCWGNIVKFIDSVTNDGIVADYFWDFGDGITSTERNPEHAYKTAGSYIVKLNLTSIYGCKDSFSQVINVDGFKKPTLKSKIIHATCGLKNAAIIPEIENGNEPYTFIWSTGEKRKDRYNLDAGTYIFTVEDAKGCQFTDTFTVKEEYYIQVKTREDTSIYLGDKVFLYGFTDSAKYIKKVLWSPALHVECDTCLKTFVKPIENTNYTLTITDIFGCPHISNVNVTILNKAINIPNAFTPNGDNLNDMFGINSPAIKTITYSIYNRWGECIFTSSDKLSFWNGQFKGKDVPEGVYLYYGTVTYLDNKPEYIKGTINLLR